METRTNMTPTNEVPPMMFMRDRNPTLERWGQWQQATSGLLSQYHDPRPSL